MKQWTYAGETPTGSTASPDTETILVSGVGGPAGRALVTQLQERGIRVIGMDSSPQPDADDDVILCPLASDSTYISFLRELIRNSGITLFIPTVQDELPVVSTAVPLLGCAVAVADTRAVQLCHDKLFTALYLQERGVPVPALITGALPEPGQEVVVKPRVSRGGRGVRLVETGDDPGDITGDLIMQEFAPGTEYCPQSYRSPVNGDITTIVLEKTAMKQGRIGNASGIRWVPEGHANDIQELTAQVLTSFDLVGPVDMDIRRLADGTPVVLEVNARFGANSQAAPEILDRVLEDYSPHTHIHREKTGAQ